MSDSLDFGPSRPTSREADAHFHGRTKVGQLEHELAAVTADRDRLKEEDGNLRARLADSFARELALSADRDRWRAAALAWKLTLEPQYYSEQTRYAVRLTDEAERPTAAPPTPAT